MVSLAINVSGKEKQKNGITTVFQANEEYAKGFFENEENILYTKNKKDITKLLSSRRYMPVAKVDDIFVKNFIKKNPNVNYSERNKSYAPTFYSKMSNVIDGIKTEKVGANGVIPYLTGKGVKAEEIKWSGISPTSHYID